MAALAVHTHLPQPLGPVVTVQALEGAHRGVVGVGLDLQRLLEHRSEGRVGAVTRERDLIGSHQAARPRVNELELIIKHLNFSLVANDM